MISDTRLTRLTRSQRRRRAVTRSNAVAVGSGLNERRRRRSFTLAELLIVMMILAILASMTLMALWAVMEDARKARTEAQVQKLNELLMAKWDGYRTRPVRLTPAMRTAAGNNARQIAAFRLAVLRDLMRMEMPDRVTDVTDVSAYAGSGVVPPALWQSYNRRVTAAWRTNITFQGAECLYLIVSTIQDGDSNGLDSFMSSEVKDTDGDGVPEIVDAWGMPIEFIRWPAGLDSPLQPVPRNPVLAPDTFDPVKADPRWQDADATNDPFALFPLVFSPGADKLYDIQSDLAVGGAPPMHYATLPNNPPTTYGPNDPYVKDGAGLALGQRHDANGDGRIGYYDNITNHTTGNE